MTEDKPIIYCDLSTESMLCHAYMPFVMDGGLFVRTKDTYTLGMDVILQLTLLDQPEKTMIEGKTVWITPLGAQGNKPAGIGVQFTGKNKRNLCNQIETLLAGKLKLTQPTDTM